MTTTFRILALGALLSTAACSRGDGGEETPDEGTAATTSPDEASGAPTAAQPPTTPQPSGVPVVRNAAASADRDLAQRLGLAPADPLIVSDLLTHADIREIVGYNGELSIATLEGVQPSEFYNAMRLASSESGFGFAVQLWEDEQSRQTLSRFERLQETYIDRIAETDGVGDSAFRGEFDGIRHYAFMIERARSVAVISCQTELCDSEQVRGLAERVSSRL
jgi:hypothetical protein